MSGRTERLTLSMAYISHSIDFNPVASADHASDAYSLAARAEITVPRSMPIPSHSPTLLKLVPAGSVNLALALLPVRSGCSLYEVSVTA